ncbi:glycosyltransferase family 2 protein [uncultured Polaribacter sp.]|uniref:glycosyltransferase family 2 protein n=1 Tax=uncultured Polaribacter sp. TaxID=174711 RepID=UPI00262227AB|nr:glycosyltransferase [uncultured Polaribacter sp.]
MNFSLIVCTYMRPKALLNLLKTVECQTLYPNEIIIVDGSSNNKTKDILENNFFKNLIYYKVLKQDRGLTRQRNYGISKVLSDTDIVCFLDDDTVLNDNYFFNLKEIFISNQKITGVGGLAINENKWKLNSKIEGNYNSKKYITIDGYHCKLGQRHILRNYLGIGSKKLPGIMPEFSNGLSCGYPLTGNIYEVDLLIGMSMSFRKIVVDHIKFSSFFEGYGLYEDADFSLRSLKFGKNVLATNVLLEHNHSPEGRPNHYNYGKMVIRNGWYVWRIKYNKPSLKARFKWNSIAILLMIIRFSNVFNSKKKLEALTEACGRFYGLISLIFHKPNIKR